MSTTTMFSSRAVIRNIEPGSVALCVTCGDVVKFKARHRGTQVIANVYLEGVWQRVEHYHADCYEDVGQPYGSAA